MKKSLLNYLELHCIRVSILSIGVLVLFVIFQFSTVSAQCMEYDLSGTLKGSHNDSEITVTFVLRQTGEKVTGTATMKNRLINFAMQGTVTGSMKTTEAHGWSAKNSRFDAVVKMSTGSSFVYYGLIVDDRYPDKPTYLSGDVSIRDKSGKETKATTWASEWFTRCKRRK